MTKANFEKIANELLQNDTVLEILGEENAQEMKDYLLSETEKRTASNAKRNAKRAEKNKQINEPLLKLILERVQETTAETPLFANDLAMALEITPQKATKLLGTLVSEEKIKKAKCKVKDNGKTYDRMGYFKF